MSVLFQTVDHTYFINDGQQSIEILPHQDTAVTRRLASELEQLSSFYRQSSNTTIGSSSSYAEKVGSLYRAWYPDSIAPTMATLWKHSQTAIEGVSGTLPDIVSNFIGQLGSTAGQVLETAADISVQAANLAGQTVTISKVAQEVNVGGLNEAAANVVQQMTQLFSNMLETAADEGSLTLSGLPGQLSLEDIFNNVGNINRLEDMSRYITTQLSGAVATSTSIAGIIRQVLQYRKF